MRFGTLCLVSMLLMACGRNKLQTDPHSESGIYEQFGGTIDTESTWRFLNADQEEGTIRGGYTTKWTNNTGSGITVDVGRLVFEDAIGIQIAEDKVYESFRLDAGQSRERPGNFTISATAAEANEIARMGIWARFTEREAVPSSNGIELQTDPHSESEIFDEFGGTVEMESTWRFSKTNGRVVEGGYTTKWTNNTSSDIRVSVGRPVFEDADGIPIFEGSTSDNFRLDAGQSQERQGTFIVSATVAEANQVKHRSVQAEFTRSWL